MGFFQIFRRHLQPRVVNRRLRAAERRPHRLSIRTRHPKLARVDCPAQFIPLCLRRRILCALQKRQVILLSLPCALRRGLNIRLIPLGTVVSRVRVPRRSGLFAGSKKILIQPRQPLIRQPPLGDIPHLLRIVPAAAAPYLLIRVGHRIPIPRLSPAVLPGRPRLLPFPLIPAILRKLTIILPLSLGVTGVVEKLSIPIPRGLGDEVWSVACHASII